MGKLKSSVLISILFVLTMYLGIAQDKEINIEDSSEVFLEEYSDAFQENFFEALKQKGIENYDKAINLLLECKLIDAGSNVVDHELAKVYLLDEQYITAQEYAIAALKAAPTNLWYLNTLVTSIQMQGSSLDQTNLDIPYENAKLKENLALIYFKQKKYEKALIVVTDIQKSAFTKDLTARIKDSISKQEVSNSQEEVLVKNEIKANPIEDLKTQLTELMDQNKIVELAERSEEAIENYPSQPFFYYVNGYALNKSTKPKEAVEILEAALDYILEEDPLLNKIYRELVDAHTALNNSSEANMYLRMIKPGF
ncbi:MAG: hypothetical protein KJO52_04690 [Maribacter sp.]|nr:hypothetical protein [Maribacter sp.]MBT8300278.1 hypothetical protein [Maribacter sp.]